MKRSGVLGVMVLLVAGFICGSAAAQSVPTPKSSIAEPTQKSQLAEGYGRLPLSFEINHGQADSRVKFLSRGAGQTLFLTSNEAVLALSKPLNQKPDSLGFPNLSVSHSLRTTSLRMRLLGANPLSDVTGLESLPGTSNYFIGNDPARWRTNVPTYGKVRYSQIYPGIDLVYYGSQRQLEYDFVVAPGADPEQIRLAIRGARKLSLDADGNAVVRWKDGDVRLLKPRLYQEMRGEKIEIAGGYVLKRNELRFAVGQYDHRQKLVIDPVLVYSTYLGGVNSDGAAGVAVDSAGNAYVVGTTNIGGFPVTSGVVQPTTHGTTNAFVAKLNATGTALVYSTYLGGSSQDTGYAIAVDPSGNAYVTGATTSSDFPITSGAFQSTTKPVSTPGSSVFVTKLSPDGGSLAYSTYLGGSANDLGFAIAVDASGNAYVAGETQSGNFPHYGSSPKVVGGPTFCDSLNSGGFDGFITKVSPDGATLAFSLYLGGSGTDVATGVAVDSSGDAYVSGYTSSKDFLVNNCPGPAPGANSLQSANAGTLNAFIVKVNPTGIAFLGATYLGGSGQEAATSIAVDAAGFVYLAGEGNSGGAGGVDAFGAKLNGSLDSSSKVYFTYIGGSGFDRATGVAVDSAGNEYLVGQTASTNFPQVSPVQPGFGGGTYDAFVTELSPSGGILFSTYLGGSGDEGTSIGGAPIAVDSSGNFYVVGSTSSTDFPGVTSSSIQPTNGGSNDAFIVKLGPAGAASMTALAASVNPSVFGQQVSFTATVSPSSSSGLTPAGDVTFNDSSTALATVALSSGTAIYNTTTLSVGSHSISASYGGDSNFATSASTSLPQLVNQGTTTPSVSASPNPGIFGQPVTLAATIVVVAPAAGTPTGTVTFLDGAVSLGTGTLSAGQATLTTSLLAAGSHSITATYSGDANFLGASSSVLPLGIQQSTMTTLLASPNPANSGQPITLSATVAGSSTGTPTGSVTFLDGTTTLGTDPLTAGTATLITSSLAVGSHSLTASYPGGSNFASSSSGTLPLSVLLPPVVITDNETITVTDTPSFPDVFDAESVKVTDQVAVYAFFPIAINPAPPILSGVLNQPYSGATFSGTGGYQSLALTESGAVPGMSFAIAGASATFSGTPTQAGTFPFTITATDSIGNKLSQNYSLVVSAACPAISVSPSGSLGIATVSNPFSQTFVASGGIGTTTWSTASALPLGVSFSAGILSGTPTQFGAFALTITATDQNGCQGSSNVSLLVVPPPAVITDNETITVTDTPSFPDVADAEQITVTDQVSIQVLNATTTSISINGGAVYGTAATATASVSSSTAAVTGSVTLSVDGGTPTAMPLSAGSAAFTLGNLTVGNHSLAADFAAQGSFLGSSAQTKFTVNQATPTIAWTNPSSITYPTALSSAQLSATASVPGSFVYTPAAGAVLSAGTQTLSVTITPTDSTDYTPATATVTLQVNQAVSTITWSNPAPITYGTTLSSAQLNATALVKGRFNYSPPSGTVLSAGSQTLSVKFNPTDSIDYLPATATVTLQVNQATPTITWATPAPITYGIALGSAQLNATASVPGMFVYTPPAGTVLSAGSQTLSVIFAPTDSTDYTKAKAIVTLVVNQATPAITWANPPAITYGTPLTGKQLNAISSVPGTLIYNPPAGTVLGAGSQTLTIIFAPNDNVDYTKANARVTLVVNRATPTITWANPAPITLGTPLSTTQLNATASVAGAALPGTFVYNPPLKTVLSAGTQTLSVTFTPTDSTDYQTVTQTASITVNVSGSLSIQPGQTVTFNDGSISGNVALNGGTLILAGGSTIGGNLTMSSGSLTLGGNSIIGGNVQILGGSFSIGPSTINGNLQVTNVPAGKAPGVVCGASVSGNLQFQGNGIPGEIGPATCSGNTIKGNLQITNNTAPLQIFKNTVSGDLQCSGNSSSLTGGQNTAALKQGQCAKL